MIHFIIAGSAAFITWLVYRCVKSHKPHLVFLRVLYPYTFVYKTLPKQTRERYNGNREYKRLLNLKGNNALLQKRSTQLLFRIGEGDGRALYMLGVDDDGSTNGISAEELLESLRTFLAMTKIICCTIDKVHIYHGQRKHNYCCTIRVSLTPDYLL